MACSKTCLLRRFVRDDFAGDYKATIGADFLAKDVVVGDRNVTLQVNNGGEGGGARGAERCKLTMRRNS